MGSELSLVFLLLLGLSMWGSVRAALTEGGSSPFGYDASSSCSKPISRMGRARLELPCDFRRENWCTIAGNAYPWQAVRRFVQENQGLMRRMYGDEKHISVLKTELEKNDVELEVENEHTHFYYDDTSPLYREFKLDYEFEQDSEIGEDEDDAQENREFHGRALNSGSSSKLDKQSSEETIPVRRHSHPNETPIAGVHSSTTASSISTSTTIDSTTSTYTNSSISPTLSTKLATSNPNVSTTAAAAAAETTNTIQNISTTAIPLTSSNLTTTAMPETTSTTSVINTTTIASTTTTTAAAKLVSLEQIANVQNQSINEIGTPGQIDRLDVDVEELIETTESANMETTMRIEQINIEDADGIEDTQAGESQLQPQQFRPRPEYRPPESVTTTTTASATVSGSSTSMKGQLYQDVAGKDKQEQPVLKVRGINACPVKEEVVAPFWANNTRGEVLALLNLYPFEQYVHWEKCTHENKQMYCRDGCRCEQQYRLHRLLAYDPNNECRGIFSDWFKFPSCCICRCYDLPLEFRVTSRSPRLTAQSPKRKLKVRAPRRPPRQRN